MNRFHFRQLLIRQVKRRLDRLLSAKKATEPSVASAGISLLNTMNLIQSRIAQLTQSLVFDPIIDVTMDELNKNMMHIQMTFQPIINYTMIHIQLYRCELCDLPVHSKNEHETSADCSVARIMKV